MSRAADLLAALAMIEVRERFWAFRQYINPKMKLGWWQKDACQHLQQFHDDLVAGLRPKLVIEAPPQHGKSETIVDFIAWAIGHNPSLKTIYGSFSTRLGKRANKRLQRILRSQKYRQAFPGIYLQVGRDRNEDGDRASMSQELIEFLDADGRILDGSFRNTTVLGSITGESLDLGVIDDPIKGRDAANSTTIRDKTWDWFTDDFLTRFSESAGLLIILTRWHPDDPVGRMKKKEDGVAIFPDLKVLRYQAIATTDEEHRKEGEALFPDHKSLEFLAERKRALGTANFEALYQQNPVILGGMLIKGQWFPRIKQPPKIVSRKIYGDTAQKTAERNDYSVFECWGLGDDHKLYLLDMLRGKWEAPELRQNCIAFWNKHKDTMAYPHHLYGTLSQLMIEDKASGTGLIQEITRTHPIPVKGIERVKDKLTRVQDGVPFIEAGFVCLLEDAPYVSDFVAECELFTPDDSHEHDDQIDPMLDAIVDLLSSKRRSMFI